MPRTVASDERQSLALREPNALHSFRNLSFGRQLAGCWFCLIRSQSPRQISAKFRAMATKVWTPAAVNDFKVTVRTVRSVRRDEQNR